jgi:hypothetical protein
MQQQMEKIKIDSPATFFLLLLCKRFAWQKKAEYTAN